MSELSNLVQAVELLDARGRSLGLFRSEEVVKELVVERDRLRQELAQLQAKLSATAGECDRLREELVGTRRERDEYLHSLHFLTRQQFAFTPEEIATLDREGLPLGQVVDEIERRVKGDPDACAPSKGRIDPHAPVDPRL
jgi:chromosome segregation ATPase